MTQYNREEKIAFARIVTDLIEADFVVEPDEMRFFEKIISKDCLGITDSMLIEAKKIDFAKAVSILKDLDLPKRNEAISILKELSLSDGACVPLEAILIFAIEQVLLHDATIHSIPSNGVNIENLQVIYVENEDSTETGRQIERNYNAIDSLFKLAGFDFVYIPNVVNDFKIMAPDYLSKVIKYMIPSISMERTALLCGSLRELTTSKFCRELLYKRMGLNLIDSKPSLLVKINDSDIVDKFETEEAERIRFSNFIQIELKDNVCERINSFIESYYSMMNSPITVVNKPRSGKFIYSGFHRSLFELIAYGREQKEYRLVFELKRGKPSVYFESLDEAERLALKLNPQETALYYMIVKTSLDGKGLDWREHLPPGEKQAILAEYNRIYRIVGKANSASEFKDRTQVHHIKNRIRTIQCMSNADMFIPEHTKEGGQSYYRIKAGENYVLININTTL